MFRILCYGLSFCLLVSVENAFCQSSPVRAATVREYKQAFSTLSYHDANPIAAPAGVYPYVRYDGFGGTPIQKEWTVMELENEWIKVLVLPELGGRIWTAIEKRTGKPFLFQNDRIHFLDMGVRGPWVAGGLSIQHGALGHVGTTAMPVNYAGGRRSDGTAYCLIGLFDLATRTHVTLSIEVPGNRAYFLTRSTWHNSKPYEISAYRWASFGLDNSDPVVYSTQANTPTFGPTPQTLPNACAGFEWKQLSSQPTDFFSAYWPTQQLGIGHFSLTPNREQEATWLWENVGQGAAWSGALSDTVRYAEVQRGQIYYPTAQTAPILPPYRTQDWFDCWFPIVQTGGVSAATPLGSLYVTASANKLAVQICPLEEGPDTLRIFEKGRLIHTWPFLKKPLETVSQNIAFSGDLHAVTAVVAQGKLTWSGEIKPTASSRPNADMHSRRAARAADALQFVEAHAHYDTALQERPDDARALSGKAALWLRQGKPIQAAALLDKWVNTPPTAPTVLYTWALAQYTLGKHDLAKKAYEALVKADGWEPIAHIGLAKIAIRERAWQQAVDHAVAAGSPQNPTARILRSIGMRALNPGKFGAYSPVQYPFSLPDWLESNSQMKPMLRDELPLEHYMEAAVLYAELSLPDEAQRTLAYAPEGAEKYYWLAWLAQQQNQPDQARSYLTRANQWSPYLVFPFRTESLLPLQWAVRQQPHWKPNYYLALLHQALGNVAEAKQHWEACANQPDYGSFYVARAQAVPNTLEADLRRAQSLEPKSWRPVRDLMDHYLAHQHYAKAKGLLDSTQVAFPKAVLYAERIRTAYRTGDVSEAVARIGNACLPPHQHAAETRQLVRSVLLTAAVKATGQQQWENAKKYVDEAQNGILVRCFGSGTGGDAPEKYVLALWFAAQKKTAEATQLWQTIVDGAKDPYGSADAYWVYLAYKKLGKHTQARDFLNEWQRRAPHDVVVRWAKDPKVKLTDDWGFFLQQMPKD